LGKDIFKDIAGKTFEDAFRFPSIESSLDHLSRKTNYPLRTIGYTTDDAPFILSEEERTHTHIIGTTDVGKSKLMQLFIREDIDRGNGLCLIDSSDGGDTAYKILAYCAKKKIKNVLLIDPLHYYTHNKIVPINPFGRDPDESAEKIWDTIQVQFQQTDRSLTPVINQYLPAIIRVLHKAGATFSDAIYFTDPFYVRQRQAIFEKLSPIDPDVMMLNRIHKGDRQLDAEFRPTARRLSDLLNPILRSMFDTRDGIDFRKFIAEHWVVIVNLFPENSLGLSHARFLGTTIINEFARAVGIIHGSRGRKGWEGRYYLYVDEAGYYANRNVAHILSIKGKTGLRMILANQYLGQFEDPFVRQAVLNQTSIKMILRSNDDTDQKKLAAMVYGGQIRDRDAGFFFSRLKKQECVVKLPAQDPVKMRVSEVRDVPLDPAYIETLYQDPLYLSPKNYETPTHQRSADQNPQSRTKPDRVPARQNVPREAKHRVEAPRHDVQKKPPDPKKNTYRHWDDLVLQDKGRQKKGGK